MVAVARQPKKKVRSWSGAKLKALRERVGMTQKDLADAVEIYPADVSNYERDKSEPTFTVLCKLAEALEAQLNDFAPSPGGK